MEEGGGEGKKGGGEREGGGRGEKAVRGGGGGEREQDEVREMRGRCGSGGKEGLSSVIDPDFPGEIDLHCSSIRRPRTAAPSRDCRFDCAWVEWGGRRGPVCGRGPSSCFRANPEGSSLELRRKRGGKGKEEEDSG